MVRDPRDPDEAIIEGRDLKRMVFESGIIGAGVLGAFYYGVKRYGLGPGPATLAFNTLTLSELAHSLSSRSPYKNVFGGQKLPPNKYLTQAILGMGALQAIISVVPAARRLLGTTPMTPADLAAVAAGVLLPLVINEATKPSYKPVEEDEEFDTEAKAQEAVTTQTIEEQPA
jgi:Ca2+-transporting ATPase